MIEIDIDALAGDFSLTATARARTPGIIGLFGPSGAGKTTLLRALAGLQPVVRGQVTLDGAPLAGRPETRRIGYVFQDARLFPHLSVRDNLLFGLKRAEQPHRLALDDVSDTLAIGPLLERAVRGLSGGEQKRVALGRALLRQPQLILMDEPLSGVDGARKAEIVHLIRRVRARFDATILLVSHDLDEIAALADDVMLIEAGKIIAAGAAAAIFADPASALADRPDARALIDGVLTVSDAAHGIAAATAGDTTLTLPWIEEAPGAAIRIQVFARDVTLAARPPEAISTQNVLPARVRALRVRPDRLTLVALETPAGALLATITQQASERLGLGPEVSTFALVKASAFAPR